jgi:hypothetical protein
MAVIRTFSESHIGMLVDQAMEIDIGESIEWLVPLELSMDEAINMVLGRLPKNRFYITPIDSKGAIKIIKTHNGGQMKTVYSIEGIRNSMKNCTTDETFAIAEEVDPVQFMNLIEAIESSGDLTVSEYNPDTTPRTITILCRY